MTSTGVFKIILPLFVFFILFYGYHWYNTTQSQISGPPHTEVYPTPNKKNNTNEKDTILLIWFWPFGIRFDLHSCASKYQISGCHLTDDRSLYSSADGVLIHHRDIAHDLSNLPKQPRPFFQKWIWMLFESPYNSHKISGLDNMFNVTMNYRQDADITVREQLQLKNEEAEKSIPVKTKTLCWIVSNWKGYHARTEYYNQLNQYIRIETFGRHFNHGLSGKDYTHTVETCKFYLSFENTHERSDHIALDYITEKLYNPLRLGTVPVVLGPPRGSYEKFIPRDAFIHVDDFKSPKELADYLHMLNNTDEKYRQFFNWRKHLSVTDLEFPQEHACRACHYIRTRKYFQVFTNLNKWYWG